MASTGVSATSMADPVLELSVVPGVGQGGQEQASRMSATQVGPARDALGALSYHRMCGDVAKCVPTRMW